MACTWPKKMAATKLALLSLVEVRSTGLAGRQTARSVRQQAASRALTGVYSPAFLKLRGHGQVAASGSQPQGWLIGPHRAAVHLNRLRVLNAMEINPILNSIKDLSERTLTIRGYL